MDFEILSSKTQLSLNVLLFKKIKNKNKNMRLWKNTCPLGLKKVHKTL